MGLIRSNNPLGAGGSPYLKKSQSTPVKVAPQKIVKAEVPAKGDQVQLTGGAPQPKAEAKPETVAKPQAEEGSKPQAKTADNAPSTLIQESATPAESEVDDETTNWVLESVASTPYANDPSMEVVKRRFGTLNKAVRSAFTDPLLDAITTSDQEMGSKKLKGLATTANWAQKFKKDAARLVEDGGYEAMLKKATEAEGGDKKAATLLDGVLKAKSLRFSSELPPVRANEANKLLQQFENGNENPGIGSKALGKGISYLRGRKGTRIFYKQQGDETQWLAVCDKSTEPKAIKTLQKEFKL